MKTVELLADKFILTENERNNIFTALVRNDDNTRYGLLNAVTEASKLAKNYDRATELERMGGEILSLPVPRHLLPPPNFTEMQTVRSGVYRQTA